MTDEHIKEMNCYERNKTKKLKTLSIQYIQSLFSIKRKKKSYLKGAFRIFIFHEFLVITKDFGNLIAGDFSVTNIAVH